MGRGDKKTRQGKIRRGSHGITRPRGKKKKATTTARAKAPAQG